MPSHFCVNNNDDIYLLCVAMSHLQSFVSCTESFASYEYHEIRLTQSRYYLGQIQSCIKGTGHDSIFQILLFSTLGDIFAVQRPLFCTKLIHQSSPAEMIYLMQESQIFAV